MSLPDVPIERALSHGRSVRREGLREHQIPEWGKDGEPLVAYSQPSTLAERRKIWPFIIDDDIAAYAWVVGVRLKDENGKRLFSDEDIEELIASADADVIVRVANEIGGIDKAQGQAPTMEEAKGNSDGTPISDSSTGSPNLSAAR